MRHDRGADRRGALASRRSQPAQVAQRVVQRTARGAAARPRSATLRSRRGSRPCRVPVGASERVRRVDSVAGVDHAARLGADRCGIVARQSRARSRRLLAGGTRSDSGRGAVAGPGSSRTSRSGRPDRSVAGGTSGTRPARARGIGTARIAARVERRQRLVEVDRQVALDRRRRRRPVSARRQLRRGLHLEERRAEVAIGEQRRARRRIGMDIAALQPAGHARLQVDRLVAARSAAARTRQRPRPARRSRSRARPAR